MGQNSIVNGRLQSFFFNILCVCFDFVIVFDKDIETGSKSSSVSNSNISSACCGFAWCYLYRYINRAGIVGCCSGYPGVVKQAELKWAEKGPRKAGERAFRHSTMTSRSRSPLTPRTPRTPRTPNKAAGVSMSQDLPSFVTSAPYSPYSAPKHHHLPL